MAKFWKLWGGMGGTLVGIIVVAIAWQTPLGECTGTLPSVETCTLLGYTPAEAGVAITAIFTWLGTVLSPKNA